MENLEMLEEQARSIEQLTRREEPDVSKNMRNLRSGIQREEIERNMQESKNILEQGWLLYANLKEEEIQESLERLDSQVRTLENAIPVTDLERLNRNIEDARALIDKYNDLVGDTQEDLRTSELTREEQQNQQQAGQRRNQQNQQQSGQNQNRQNQQNQQNRQNQQGQQNQQQSGQQQAGGGGQQQDIEAAQMRSQLEQMQQMIENMQRSNQGDPRIEQTLNAINNALADHSFTGVLLDEAAKDYFRENVYTPLSQLEQQLLQSLDELEMENKLHGSRKADVPHQYRKLVDKYYESIAKKKKGGKR